MVRAVVYDVHALLPPSRVPTPSTGIGIRERLAINVAMAGATGSQQQGQMPLSTNVPTCPSMSMQQATPSTHRARGRLALDLAMADAMEQTQQQQESCERLVVDSPMANAKRQQQQRQNGHESQVQTNPADDPMTPSTPPYADVSEASSPGRAPRPSLEQRVAQLEAENGLLRTQTIVAAAEISDLKEFTTKLSTSMIVLQRQMEALQGSPSSPWSTG